MIVSINYKIFLGIQSHLLESESHQCPTCNETGQSPDTLPIPNRFWRKAVLRFQNETGYSKLKKNGEISNITTNNQQKVRSPRTSR